ncbi:DUF6994 family protein [Tropicimonas aquimaris]|uniref:DUF6994 family protein n=1 Tax=Tropicimonas aquimaris TaxID=914152 RepID=A0ABW3ISL9_9RHOB
MNGTIDTTFDVYSDTPSGRDPDSHSQTLRRFHRVLWSKPLPGGSKFDLTDQHPKTYLYHSSALGEFHLSSDSIGHTYRHVREMAAIVEQVPEEELSRFFTACSTIGAYIVFPSRRIDNKPTINGARGLHRKIRDRFDLTLECIRRHYLGEVSPLTETLERYAGFFELFETFEGYVDFFLLQDLLLAKGGAVGFFLPFDGFDAPPLPSDLEAYRHYREKLVTFVAARNCRIIEQTKTT